MMKDLYEYAFKRCVADLEELAEMAPPMAKHQVQFAKAALEQARPGNQAANLELNHHKPWTPEEDQRLIEEWGGTKPLDELAIIFQRSCGAVASRLAKYNKISKQELEAIIAPAKQGTCPKDSKTWDAVSLQILAAQKELNQSALDCMATLRKSEEDIIETASTLMAEGYKKHVLEEEARQKAIQELSQNPVSNPNFQGTWYTAGGFKVVINESNCDGWDSDGKHKDDALLDLSERVRGFREQRND